MDSLYTAFRYGNTLHRLRMALLYIDTFYEKREMLLVQGFVKLNFLLFLLIKYSFVY